MIASLALGFAGCGDDGEDSDAAGTAGEQTGAAADGSSSRETATQPGPGGAALSGDVEQARRGAAAVDDVYEGFSAAAGAGVAAADVPARDTLEAAGDDESLTNVCDAMSETAKRQTIVYAKRSAGLADVTWTCENATGLLLRRANQSGGLKRTLRAEIVGVNAEGDRATASVRFGRRGAISTIPLVKEDGEWKLAASPTGGSGQ